MTITTIDGQATTTTGLPDEGLPLNAGIRQSFFNPLMNDLSGDTERRKQWAAAGEKLDAALLDPDTHFKAHPYQPRFAEDVDQAKRNVLVHAYLRQANGGAPVPMGADGLELMRRKVARARFGGRGENDANAFHTEIVKEAQGRKDKRELLTDLEGSATLSASLPAADGKQGFAAWREKARAMPGYQKNREPDYFEAWAETERQRADMIAPFREELAEVWSGMQAGKTNFFGVYDKIPEDERDGFKHAIGYLARAMPKEERATFLGNLRKQSGRQAENIGMDALGAVGNSLDEFRQMGLAADLSDARAAEDAGERRRKDFVRDVRDIAEGVFDPVKPTVDWLWDPFERGIYAAPGATMTTLMALVPYVGQVATFGVIREDAYQTLRGNLLESGNFTDDEASSIAGDMATIAAIPSTLLERVGAKAVTGQLPGLDKALVRVADKFGKNALARFGARIFGGATVETFQENAQDLLPSLVQEIGAGLSEDIPDVNWNGEGGVFDDYWAKSVEVFVATLPLAIFGAAGGRVRENRVAAFAEASDLELRAFGVTEEALAGIRAADGPASLGEAVTAAVATRDGTSETARDATQELAESLQAQREALESARASGMMPDIVRTADGFAVLDGETKEEIGTAPDMPGAMRIVSAHTAALDDQKAERVAYLATMLEAGDEALAMAGDPNATNSFELGTVYTEAVAAAEDPAAIDQFSKQAAIQEQVNGGDGSVTYAALGRNVAEARGLVRTFTNRLFSGASATTIVHETVHGMVRRAEAAGALTRDDKLQFVKAVNEVMQGRVLKKGRNAGQSLALLPAGITDDMITDDMINEGISHIAEAEILRTRKRAKGAKPLKLSSGIISRNLLALSNLIGLKRLGKFRALIDGARGVFGLSSARALAMKKAVREGRINESEYEGFLAKLTGLTQVDEFDGMVRDEHAAIVGREEFTPTEDAPFSMAPASAGDGFDGEAHKREVAALEKSAPLGKNGKPLAPNGKESNLTLRQWATVRTAAFKNWFGDWQSVATREQLKNMPAVALDGLFQRMASGAELKDAARSHFRDVLMKQDSPVTVDGRKVEFTMTGFKEMARHSADSRVLQMIPSLPGLIRQALPLFSEPNADTSKPNIKAYHHYAIKGTLGNGDFYIRLVAREDTGGHVHYDADATSIEAFKEDGEVLSTQPDRKPKPGEDVAHLAKNRLAQWWNAVNPESVSKVVDENGEPLPVYHGTAENFEAFDRAKSKRGFFFTSNREDAARYAEISARGTDAQGKESSFFLNSLNPDTEELKTAEQRGHDGFNENDMWVAFAPTQIKSVDNRGSFDPADDRHAFSLAPSSMVEGLQMNAAARIRDPRVKAAMFTRMVEKLGALKRDKDELGIAFGKGYKRKAIEDPRKTASIRRERNFREAARRAELEDEAHARHSGILHNEDIDKIKAQPVHAHLADPTSRIRGRLMSASAAISRGEAFFDPKKQGDFDGADGVSRSNFGGSLMPDQAAQELFDAGLIKEPTPDAMWEALKREQSTVARMKEFMKAAREDLGKARLQAKEEATAWEIERLKQEAANYSPRQRLLRALAMLDGILSVLPAEVRGKIGGYTQLAKLTSDEARLKFLNERVDRADREIERYLVREYGRLFTKLLDREEVKKNTAGKKPTGKAGAEVHALFASMRRAMLLTGEEVQDWADTLQAKIARGDLTPDEEAAASIEAGLVILAGDWANADATRRAAALESATRIFEDGYYGYQAEKMHQREQRKLLRESLARATGSGGTAAERDAKFLADHKLKGGLKNFALSLGSFEQLMTFVFGEGAADAARIVAMERQASDQAADGKQARMDALDQVFRDLAGGAYAGEVLRAAMGKKTLTIGGRNLSELEAITATLMWRQADGRRHMEGHKDEIGNFTGEWHYGQEFIDEIEAALSDNARAVRLHLATDYAGEWATLNPIFKKLNGINLPRHTDYSPLIVAPSQAMGGQMGASPEGSAILSGTSMTPGSLRSRGSSIAEPVFADALQTYISHVMQMEHWKAYAEFATEAQAVLNNRTLGNAVEAAGGKEAVKLLRGWVDYFAQGGVRDATAHLAINQTFARFMNNAAATALVGRMSVLAIQSTQLGAALAEVPVTAYLKRLGKLMTGNLGWGDALKSGYIQRRLQQMPPVVRQAMDGLRAGDPSQLKHQVAKIGRMISGADALFTAGTYAIVYDYHLTEARKTGQANAEAIARQKAEASVDRVAQPVRAGARSFYEVTATNPMIRLSWAFASENRQKLALTGFTLANPKASVGRKVRAAAVTWVVGGMVATLIRAVVRDLRDSDDDEWFDDKNWGAKRLALSAATGPLQAIPMLGDAAEAGLFALAGEYLPDGNMISAVPRAAQRLKRVPDWLTGDRDFVEALKDAEIILSGMGVFHEGISAAASVSHFVTDTFRIIDNATGD